MLKNFLCRSVSTPWLALLALACVPAVFARADSTSPVNDIPDTSNLLLVGKPVNDIPDTSNLLLVGKSKGSPTLAGNAVSPQIKRKGSNYQIKSDLVVQNTGTGKAKNVSVTVYLSDDGTLDAKDTKLKTLSLADYDDGNGKIAAGKEIALPFKQKVPTMLAQAVEGKYLIAVLEATNATAATTDVVLPAAVADAAMPATVPADLLSLPIPDLATALPAAGVTYPPVLVMGNQVIIGPIKLP